MNALGEWPGVAQVRVVEPERGRLGRTAAVAVVLRPRPGARSEDLPSPAQVTALGRRLGAGPKGVELIIVPAAVAPGSEAPPADARLAQEATRAGTQQVGPFVVAAASAPGLRACLLALSLVTAAACGLALLRRRWPARRPGR